MYNFFKQVGDFSNPAPNRYVGAAQGFIAADILMVSMELFGNYDSIAWSCMVLAVDLIGASVGAAVGYMREEPNMPILSR
jgi:hypothetical protein